MAEQSLNKVEQMQIGISEQKLAKQRPNLRVVDEACFMQKDPKAWSKFLDRKRGG